MKLRGLILVVLLVFGLAPLLLEVAINLPLVLERTALFYQRAYLLNLRADFRDLDQHLASRHEMIRLLAKLPEPGLILGGKSGAAGEAEQVDLARARYTGWVNQILADQRDIVRVQFLDDRGEERFWLDRDPRTLEWRPTAPAAAPPPGRPPQSPRQPNASFIAAGLAVEPGEVLVSRIRVDPAAGALDPRHYLTLDLVSPIGGQRGQPLGVVVMVIDLGGLAQSYRDTVWVNQDGSYLRPGRPVGGGPEAFQAFPGLERIFAQRALALWQGPGGRQLLWVPMFATENGDPLWVGRAVDPSPIENFRNALMVRVLSIILVLVLVVLVLARWIARRIERFGQELTLGIGGVLRDGLPLRLRWRGPREIRQLGEQLRALAETHAEHLRESREHTAALERSNHYKSQFLANVSHELRTPLNSILLLSKMLAAPGSGLSEAQRRQAQVIHAAGTDLRTLIDDILDISRIEAGQVPLSLEWVELPAVLEDVMALVAPLTGDKPVALRVAIDPGAPASIYTDLEKLRQILKNFLSNAIKFTDRGSVTLEAAASGDPECPLALSVTDTGIGIHREKHGIIFEAFQQADGSTRRRYGGTGLGLSISRELAQRLGGRITVESAPGAGARFILVLPLVAGSGDDVPAPIETPVPSAALRSPPSAPATDGERPKAAPAVCAGPWVLVVARDVPTLIHLTEAIGAEGLAVQTAADLDEALETLREEPPGCVLVLLAADVSKRGACDTIERLLNENQGQAPAVAVVGEATDASWMAACRAAGAVAVLSAPLDPVALRSLLARLAPKTPGK